ncbi:GNAT family N-acetyltransferase [Tsukamurella sp. NPDC003166]|uniref:GNAT family N-acetyltransferase n=1 Tax=Tsukamurella sp. NPDC003166 TaxID=3154444 RepID=UPI0033BF132C
MSELIWRTLASKRDCRYLQSFSCTTPRLTVDGSVRRAPHPRPWELEAQSMIRRLSESKAARDVVFVAERPDGTPVAVAHISPSNDGRVAAVHLNVIAVGWSDRGLGLADRVLDRVRAESVAYATAECLPLELISATIHTSNQASIHMAQRNGFEPTGSPVGHYQTWIWVPAR